MAFLALHTRWHRVRRRWLLVLRNRVLIPLLRGVSTRLMASDKIVNDLASRPRLRMAVCETCPLLTATKICDGKQGGCGCFMPIKVQISGARCPKGKW